MLLETWPRYWQKGHGKRRQNSPRVYPRLKHKKGLDVLPQSSQFSSRYVLGKNIRFSEHISPDKYTLAYFRVKWRPLFMCTTRERSIAILGAFHYAKDTGNFGWNSNGKIRFGFFWPEFSGSPLEVVHIFAVGNIPTGIRSSIFDKPVLYPQGIREFKMTRAISINWPGLIEKCRSVFLRYSRYSRSVWHNEKHRSRTQCDVRAAHDGKVGFNS